MYILSERVRLMCSWVTLLLACVVCTSVHADSSITIPTADEAQRVNENKVGVVFTHEELYHQLVHNMEDELESKSGLRIVPIMGKNHVQSVYDLLHLKGVDLALVRADAIEYVSRIGEYPAVKRVINSVAKVSEEKIIVIARKDYETMSDLDGQVVGFGVPGSGEFVTGTVAFSVLGIAPNAIEVNNSTAIEKMKTGELAAMVYLLRAPDAIQTGNDLNAANAVKNLELGDDLHIMEIPENAELSEIYSPSTLTSADLPGLIDDGSTIPTYAVDAILAVYRWAPPNFRLEQSQRFINAFVEGLDGLQRDEYQPVWKRVNFLQETPNIIASPLVQVAVDAIESDKARLMEEKRLAEEQEVLAEREAKIEALLKKTENLTARLGDELNQADADELEKMLNELDSFLVERE